MNSGIQISSVEPSPVAAMQHTAEIEHLKAECERLTKFVGQVASMQMWSCDKPDGTPYQECEQPSDGFLDSHCVLMGLIETSRELLKPQ